MSISTEAVSAWQTRVDAAEWEAIASQIDALGCALTTQLLTNAETDRLVDLYDNDDAFRSTVDMGQHRFGEDEYRYLAQPLPEPVEELRQALHPKLLPIARDWHSGSHGPTPLTTGWTCATRLGKPSPLLSSSPPGPGDWNALHRDLYRELVFPLQVVVNLTAPEIDYRGGVSARRAAHPDAVARHVHSHPRGHGLVFTTRDRPVTSQRGWAAAPVRHGVSVVRSGRRVTLGLPFQDSN